MKQGIDHIGVGVGGLLIHNKKVLLLKRNKNPELGCYGLIGGRIEKNEFAEDTMKRESKEEIGVDVNIVSFLGYTNHIILNENTHWVSLNFLIKLVNENDFEKIKNAEPNIHEKIQWFESNKLKDVKLTMPATESLKMYKDFIVEKLMVAKSFLI